ncbi:MAG: bifunctional oligoribonuclease/PAP phosphatase NrnA [Chloroflexota bacterium]
MHKPPEYQAASDAVASAKSILVVTHTSPDGDAIGSSLGLANALRAMGKDVTVAVDEGLPDFFAWLPKAQTIVGELPADASWDVMISTDASDEVRSGAVGKIGFANSKTVINIDHHITNTYFGDIHLVMPDAASATQVVFNWWEHMSIDWTYDIAQPLLTGLVTDTGGFRTNSTTPDVLTVAQKLMRHGASLIEATQRSLNVRSPQELAVWQRILPKVTIDNGIAILVVTQEDMHSANLDYFDMGGIANFLLGTTNVQIAATFRQDEPELYKLSMRSKPGFDVSQVAFQLGGGGHKQASGASIDGDINSILNKVAPLLAQAIEKGTPEIA